MANQRDQPRDEVTIFSDNSTTDEADRLSDEVINSLESSRKVLIKLAVTVDCRIYLVPMAVFIIAIGIVFAWWWTVYQIVNRI